MPGKPKSIDDYLARVPAERRRALERLRATIRGILPGVEECISYSMPAFRYGGHVVAGFLATAKGCSYFPFSGSTLATLAAELAAYDRTKSALHFDAARPLPKALVSKLLKARIAESGGTPTTRVAGRNSGRTSTTRVARSNNRGTPKTRVARRNSGGLPKRRAPRTKRATRE